jgi:predicted dehydrogenase
VGSNLRLARRALESGRPVMLETPAGTDRDEYRQLIDLARRKNRHVQLIYLFRVRRLKALRGPRRLN